MNNLITEPTSYVSKGKLSKLTTLFKMPARKYMLVLGSHVT